MRLTLLLSATAGLVLATSASAQLTFDTTLPGTFMDISATGAPLSLADDGEVDIATTIGNALLPAGTARVGSNGAVRFGGSGLDLGFTNGAIPAVGAFGGDQTLMPFWDDINTQNGAAGEIYWQELGGMLIIQWDAAEFFGGTGDTVTFQIQVPSTGTTWARYVYADVMQVRPAGGGSATIGYQAGGFGNDVPFSFDTPGSVSDMDVLSLVGTFTPPPPASPVTIVSNLPGTFIDISMTGIALSLGDDDEVDIPTTVGNSVLAAGVARVGSNGAVRFDGTGPGLGFGNQPIPSANAFGGDQTLMPFWDDFDTNSGTEGEIYYQEVGGVLIIQWEAAEFFPGGTGGVDIATFQIQVFPGAGPMIAQYLYESVDSFRADTGGSATIGFQSGSFGNYDDNQWSFDTTGSVMNGTVLSILAAPAQIGTNYCMANPNSTGTTGVMSATGSANVALNDLTLVGSDLPNNAFGFFIVSATQGFVANPGGSEGNLCLGGAIGRYVGAGQIQNSGSTGEISLLIDNQLIPSPAGFFAVASGDVLSFQAWHRDSNMGVAVSNFTDGLEVTFN